MAKLPEGLRADLGAAIAQQKSLWGYKKSLLAAEQQLRSDERVLDAATTVRSQARSRDKGILIVTDKRLLFVGASMLSKASEEIPYVAMSGVMDRRALGASAIVITGSGGITTAFGAIPKDRLKPLMDAIRSHLVPGARPAGTSTSDADEIRKLAELRDAGILTEQEFAAKKRQLLGL